MPTIQSRRQAEITLKDAQGNEHGYVLTVHPVKEGLPLWDTLMRLAGKSARTTQAQGDAVAVLVGVVGATIENLGLQGTLSLATDALKYVDRDGASLSKSLDCFAGNYGELREAVLWAIGENYGSFLGAAWRSGDGLQSTLRSMFQEVLSGLEAMKADGTDADGSPSRPTLVR